MLQAAKSRVRLPDEVNGCFQFTSCSQVRYGPGVDSASIRNEYQKHKKNSVSGSRARPVRRADNLTIICEPIV
jgi:hypothetical protein